MNIIYDAKLLAQLTRSFEALSGIRARVLRADAREAIDNPPEAPRRARISPACAESSDWPARGEALGLCLRRCRSGARFAALPLRAGERREPLAWLCVGPYLDGAPARRAAPLPPQCAACLAGLKQLSPEGQAALSPLLEAMADSIRLRGLILPAEESDLRRLERFLDEHYMEKLSLASVSAQLHIGRTRLCALAKELSGGETLFAMIAGRRISAAKALLVRDDRPISAVAEAVGISDYNYFSKIFRAAVGVSPSEFRKRSRHDLDNMV